jgi:6-phosphogluconate dehydrogenase (decarboxylating)
MLSIIFPLSTVGLGHMGSKMVSNISSDGNSMVIYDANPETAKALATDTIRAVVGGRCRRDL